MKPFAAPANSNTPALVSACWQLPMASWAAAIDLAASQMRCWTALHEAAFEAGVAAWSAPTRTETLESSPAMACVAADVREASAAMLQAQLDTMAALRRSA